MQAFARLAHAAIVVIILLIESCTYSSLASSCLVCQARFCARSGARPHAAFMQGRVRVLGTTCGGATAMGWRGPVDADAPHVPGILVPVLILVFH